MMTQLLLWIDADDTAIGDPLVRVAVAHLWFVTIHPFDDGNGRLCRAITELLLSRIDRTPRRYYSLSSQILSHRNGYYAQLEAAQHGGQDVTPWVQWFLQTLQQALLSSIDQTERVVAKARFWNAHRATPFNERQRKVLNMLLDGFQGPLSTSKWYKINHCSQERRSAISRIS